MRGRRGGGRRARKIREKIDVERTEVAYVTDSLSIAFLDFSKIFLFLRRSSYKRKPYIRAYRTLHAFRQIVCPEDFPFFPLFFFRFARGPHERARRRPPTSSVVFPVFENQVPYGPPFKMMMSQPPNRKLYDGCDPESTLLWVRPFRYRFIRAGYAKLAVNW